MPTPSLLIVPARFKTGKLYSQIPTSGAGDFTVTRNTAARRFNDAGLLESVASGIPRLDYYTSGGVTGCPALLVEPAATNLARWVNQMTAQDTPAASGGMAITTGSTDFLAPDGTSGSITKYVGGAASGSSQNAYYSGGQVTASASGVHTFSLFVKRGATNPLNFCAIGFALFTGASGTATSFFNLASGTAITAGASVQDYGNGWYRLTTAPYTLAAADLSGQVAFNMAATSGSLSFATSGALNLTAYTWGAQLETGSVATSYIPTTTGTGSRSGDVISVSGAVSGSIGQTEGTIYLEVNAPSASSQFFRINVGTSNAIHIYKNASDRYQVRIYPSASFIDLTDTSAKSGFVKIAIAYKSGETALVINGGTPITSASSYSFSAALNTINFLGGVEAVLPARIRAVALYTTRLTNAELATLTTP